MNFSIAELFLLAWASVATFMWGYTRAKHAKFVNMTFMVAKAISKGDAKFVFNETDDQVTVRGVTK